MGGSGGASPECHVSVVGEDYILAPLFLRIDTAIPMRGALSTFCNDLCPSQRDNPTLLLLLFGLTKKKS